MADEFELNAELRTDLGKGASRRLRRLADLVPAVVYGAGKDPVSITIPHKDLQHSLENEAFFAHIIKLKIGSDAENVIIKDLQRHPAKPRILHADFLRVKMDQVITVEVPLHFVNEESCVGVKRDGGMVSHVASSLEINCLPGKLPEYIEVDVANLALGESIHMSQLVLPEGITIPALGLGEDHDQVVVSVHATRATKEADSGDAGDEGSSQESED